MEYINGISRFENGSSVDESGPWGNDSRTTAIRRKRSCLLTFQSRQINAALFVAFAYFGRGNSDNDNDDYHNYAASY